MQVVFKTEKIKFDEFEEVTYEKGNIVYAKGLLNSVKIKVETGSRKGQKIFIGFEDIVKMYKPVIKESNLTVEQQGVIANKMFTILDSYGRRFVDSLLLLGYNTYEIVTMPGNDLASMWEMHIYTHAQIDKDMSEENSYPLGVLESDAFGMPLDDLDEQAGMSGFENDLYGKI